MRNMKANLSRAFFLIFLCMSAQAQYVSLVPSGSQVVSQPTGSTLAATSLNGMLNEETFPGATLDARIGAAVTSCGSNPCLVVIPPYAPTGSWSYPTVNNAVVIDKRYVNGNGFAENVTPNLRSMYLAMSYSGSDRGSWEQTSNSGTFTMDLESIAVAGGKAHDQTQANSGALLLFATRKDGNRPIWGADLNFQYHNNNNSAYGLEIDSVNQGTEDDPGDGTVGTGLMIIASGPKRNGVGIIVQGSDAKFTMGQSIRSYSLIGTQYINQVPGRVADIYFVPPDDNWSGRELVGRNSTNTADVWTMDDVGNLINASVTAQVIAASGFIDSVAYKAGGVLGTTGHCPAGLTPDIKAGLVVGCVIP
jgi:hypothetical protein